MIGIGAIPFVFSLFFAEVSDQANKARTNDDPQIEKIIDKLVDAEPDTVKKIRSELAHLGVRAMPSLISHLKDARETRDTRQAGPCLMWHDNRYYRRYRDPRTALPNVNSNRFAGAHIKSYTMRIGDVCFEAIGHIVGRPLGVVCPIPTACIVVNSPVETPEIADAVKREWSGLTVSDHKRELEQEAYDPFIYAEPYVIEQLMEYYPADGERLIVRLLSRTFYCVDDIWNVAQEEMMKVEGPVHWRSIYRKTVKGFGPDATSMIPHWLRHIYWNLSDPSVSDQGRATRIIQELFPAHNPYEAQFENAADSRRQFELVELLVRYKSKRIDDAVQNLFRRSIVQKLSLSKDGRDQQIGCTDTLARICAERMHGKGYDSEYFAYFDRRIKELQATEQDLTSDDKYSLKLLKESAKLVSKHSEE